MDDSYIRVKIIRLQKNLDQKEVADQLGMTQASYSKYENGKTQLTVSIAKSLAKIFDVPLSAILGIENENISQDNTFVRKTIDLLKDLIESYKNEATHWRQEADKWRAEYLKCRDGK